MAQDDYSSADGIWTKGPQTTADEARRRLRRCHYEILARFHTASCIIFWRGPRYNLVEHLASVGCVRVRRIKVGSGAWVELTPAGKILREEHLVAMTKKALEDEARRLVEEKIRSETPHHYEDHRPGVHPPSESGRDSNY